MSVPAHALGLGELSSKSTLNQNFNGDIALLSVDPDELSSVRVKLADPEAFDRAGVERPFYLSLLKFDPMVDARGKPVVRVSSEFPIREPFLNFLIEVNWPKGRLLREYTVLLDPPTTTRRRAPVVQPAASTTKPVAAKPAAAAPATKPAKAQPVSRPAAASPGEYGPVKANDTAWRIASRLRPSGVTMSQMMMALLEANPHAFIDNDINRLRRGSILRVPMLDEIQQLSRAEAAAAYRAQQDEWQARRDAKVQQQAVAQDEPPAAPPAQRQPSPAIAATAPPDKLRIATARPDGEGEAGAGDDNAVAPAASDLKARLIAARENAESSRQEAETLRSQVDDLQERLKNMQRLLSLKDDQLAQLQDRVVVEEAAGAEPPPAELPLPGATTDEVVMGNQIQIEDAPAVAAESDKGSMSEPAEELSKAVDDAVADLMAGAAPSAEDYRIADIPPQIDPDRIVMSGAPADSAPAIETAPAPVATPDVTLAEPAMPAARLDLDIPPQVDPDRIVLGLDQSSAAEVSDTTVITAPAEGGPNDITIDGLAGDAPAIDTASAAEPASAPVELAANEPQPVEPAASEPPASQPAESMVDPALAGMVEKNIVPIAAAGVGLLGLLGWMFTRRRRSEDDDTDKPIAMAAAAAASASADYAPAPAKAQAAVDEPILDPDALADLPDSSFLDDFAPSDINALQDETGEVDPVSEADVYIAYGRYQQAEELLQQAMSRDPDRLALKHKLLEVRYATRDADAFAALAQEMVDNGQDSVDEEAWSRARDMGRELAPGHPLFADDENGPDWKTGAAAAAAVAGGVAAASDAVDQDTLSLEDLELSELNAAYEEEASSLSELDPPSEVSVTLDLEDDSAGISLPPEPEAPRAVSLDDLEPLEFEMPDADVDDAGSTAGLSDEITDTLDLDSMMAEAEAAVDQSDSNLALDSDFSAAELQAQLDELSDLSALDSGLSEEQPATPSVGDGLGLVAEDQGPAEVGLDQPVSLDEAFAGDDVDEESLDVLDLSSTPNDEDEVGTKLDLARAYVEMGDQDGARSILEEVMVEGDEGQRDDAEKLLAGLG
ncbi:MAG: hypothetical protein KDI82_12875 [Gammaproteobacteria bacterium]|nr:hypothetical protein [Gammaproteobacteria bacterium]